MRLTELHKQMLAAMCDRGSIQIDGWCSARGKKAAEDLESNELATSRIIYADQYTVIKYFPTDAARAAIGR